MNDVRDFLRGWNKFVESKFKELIVIFFSQYRTNPSKKKFVQILSNLPLGAIVTEEELLKAIESSSLPNNNELIYFLKNKEFIKDIGKV